MMGRLFGGERIEVPCTIDLENTPESLHAYVELEGIEVGPGDTVVVQDAPTEIAFGERQIHRRMATVTRAGMIDRAATKVAAYLELTELYECGFSSWRTS